MSGGRGVERRSVLLQLAGGALLAVAPIATGLEAVAQASPMRRSIGDMALNDPTLATFRRGVRLLKARPATDVRSWGRLAAIHGTQTGGFNRCPHGNWYFLPWHRAYLMTCERLIRWVTGDASFAMPYWDWTAHRGLPQAFAAPTVGGQPNPLFIAGRVLTPASVIPDHVVGPGVISNILLQTAFEVFGSSRPAGQNSADVSWLDRPAIQGPLENNPHNQVHGRVGGIMGSGGSPMDPVFFTHHCNIDRIWADWNSRGGANPSQAMWRDTPFTGHFVNTNGSVWSPKVRDMLDLGTLGYRYPPAAGLIEPLPSGEAASARLGRVLDVLQGSGAGLSDLSSEEAVARGVLGRTAVNQDAAPSQPASATVEVDAARLEAAATAGAALTETAPTQAYAFVRDITPPEAPDVEVRVFVNLPDATPSTPTTLPNFVGSFGFFGGPHGAGHGPALKSLAIELTPALQALRAAGQPLSRQLSVKFVPIPLPGAAGHRLRIGEVAIAII